MRRPHSLRLRVVVIATLLVAAVSIVIGTISVFALQHFLMGQIDTQLTAAAARNVNASGGLPPGGPPLPGTTPPGRNDFVGAPGQAPGTVTGVFEGDGSLLVGGWVDAQGKRHALTSGQKAALSAARGDTSPVSLNLGGSLGNYRVVAARGPTGAVTVTGLPLQQVSATTSRLAAVVAGTGLVGIALAIGAAALAMGRTMRPLGRVADTALAVTALPLEKGEVRMAPRVAPADLESTVEVGRVGIALNDLLDHMEGALTQRESSQETMRRFVADASHELRTPLASIRASAQLALRDGARQDELLRQARRIDTESGRMAGLIDELLLLARLDAMPEPERRPLDLTVLVAEAVGAARIAGADHEWRLDLGDEAALVDGDALMLRRLLDNLLTNARVHTPAGTMVRASVRTVAVAAPVPGGPAGAAPTSVVQVTVADDGPGIPLPLQATIFDRFVRGDPSRSRGAGSTGLGLAIAKAVADAHGATLQVSGDGGATFVLTIPARSARGDGDRVERGRGVG